MASFTGSTIASTYKRILTITSENITASPKYIRDGDEDTVSCLSIGTTKVGVGTETVDATFHVMESDASSDTATATVAKIEKNDDCALQITAGLNDISSLFFGDPAAGSDGQIVYDHNTRKMSLVTAGSTRLSIDVNGNVGIGTNAPDSALEISKDTDADFVALKLTNESDAADITGEVSLQWDLEDTGGNAVDAAKIKVYKKQSFTATASTQDAKMQIGLSKNGTLTEVMSLDGETGYVGIGVNAPGTLLAVGDITENVNTYVNILCDDGNECGIRFTEETTDLWSLLVTGSNDQIIVYDHDASVTACHIATTDDNWSTDSDLRIKKDITNIDSCLSKINQLRPVTFQRKYSKSDRVYPGLVAQEVLPHIPLVVSGTEDSFKEITKGDHLTCEGGLSIGYSNFIPYLIKAIQELSATVDILSTKVEALENNNNQGDSSNE